MHKTLLKNIEKLKEHYSALSKGKDALLHLIEEAELPESVYNSNAIENSTLTLDETEQILQHQSIPPHSSQREVFEAINLAAVTTYLTAKLEKGVAMTEEFILPVHQTLLSHINDDFAGHFRKKGEYVRVGSHIAPAPEKVPGLIAALVTAYNDPARHPLERIIHFHLEFEHIHPFIDGNGRVGRALLNFQLKSAGYPPIIVRNKEKKEYYAALRAYDADRSERAFEHIVALLLKESLHKRIAYLEGDEIVYLSTIAKEQSAHSEQAISNAAKKQALPAFRERGRWKVGRNGYTRWEHSHRH